MLPNAFYMPSTWHELPLELVCQPSELCLIHSKDKKASALGWVHSHSIKGWSLRNTFFFLTLMTLHYTHLSQWVELESDLLPSVICPVSPAFEPWSLGPWEWWWQGGSCNLSRKEAPHHFPKWSFPLAHLQTKLEELLGLDSTKGVGSEL